MRCVGSYDYRYYNFPGKHVYMIHIRVIKLYKRYFTDKTVFDTIKNRKKSIINNIIVKYIIYINRFFSRTIDGKKKK